VKVKNFNVLCSTVISGMIILILNTNHFYNNLNYFIIFIDSLLQGK